MGQAQTDANGQRGIKLTVRKSCFDGREIGLVATPNSAFNFLSVCVRVLNQIIWWHFYLLKKKEGRSSESETTRVALGILL